MFAFMSLSRQEIFNKVADHLFKQGCQSLMEKYDETKCAYRGNNGTMCAAGCLIADEEYNSNMENRNIANLINSHDGWKSKYDRDTIIGLVSNLQIIHDTFDCQERVEPLCWNDYLNDSLSKLAEEAKLEFTAR